MQPVRAPEKGNPEQGFTLIEILLSLAILVIIFGGAYSFYIWGVNCWQKGIQRMDHQQSARAAMDYMAEELRFACEVTIDDPGEIRFRYRDDPKLYIFRQSGEEIVFEAKNGYSSHNKIALGVTGLGFQIDDGGIVQITVVCGKENDQVTMVSNIRPRNMH